MDAEIIDGYLASVDKQSIAFSFSSASPASSSSPAGPAYPRSISTSPLQNSPPMLQAESQVSERTDLRDPDGSPHLVTISADGVRAWNPAVAAPACCPSHQTKKAVVPPDDINGWAHGQPMERRLVFENLHASLETWASDPLQYYGPQKNTWAHHRRHGTSYNFEGTTWHHYTVLCLICECRISACEAVRSIIL